MNSHNLILFIPMLMPYLLFIIISSPSLRVLRESFQMLSNEQNNEVGTYGGFIFITDPLTQKNICIHSDYSVHLCNRKFLLKFQINPYNMYWIKKFKKQVKVNERNKKPFILKHSKVNYKRTFIKQLL